LGTAEELRAEQAHIDRAYARISELQANARARAADALATSTAGGLASHRIDRDALVHASLARGAALQIGDQSLCFGRLDTVEHETFHIGRLSVSDADGDPLVVDWRAPVAEAFYRATSQEPAGIVRRRHLRMHGRQVVGIDDELLDRASVATADVELVGEAALLTALSQARTGRMGDIVATIQGEQDRAIRARLEGVLVVQGGPGTGKTAVALHRAAYLLYVHRLPLATQGVLVVGPNPVFCRYVENVLPGLGETGVRLATPGQLVPGVSVTAVDSPADAAIKGDGAMADRLAAVLARHHVALDASVFVAYGAWRLEITPDESRELIGAAATKATYNAGRAALGSALLKSLALKGRAAAERAARAGLVGPEAARPDLRHMVERLRRSPDVIALLERLWPRLTAAELVDETLVDANIEPRPARSEHDAAMLDEASFLLGPRQRATRKKAAERKTLDYALDRTLSEMGMLPACPACGEELSLVDGMWDCDACGLNWKPTQVMVEEDQRRLDEMINRVTATHREGPVDTGRVDTFGHAVVDEAQDLTPMQWRVLRRRVPSGSMTIVGDLGQAKHPWAARSWEAVADQAAPASGLDVLELGVNYRTPEELMVLATAVLAAIDPALRPPRSVRRSGVEPRRVAVPAGSDVVAAGRAIAADEAAAMGDGTVAILVPPELAVPAAPDVLSQQIAEMGVDDAKGLEFDSVVLIEPAHFDLGALYVALTRSTSRLVVVHAEPLPAPLDTHPFSRQ
jgi:DNA helicase IV